MNISLRTVIKEIFFIIFITILNFPIYSDENENKITVIEYPATWYKHPSHPDYQGRKIEILFYKDGLIKEIKEYDEENLEYHLILEREEDIIKPQYIINDKSIELELIKINENTITFKYQWYGKDTNIRVEKIENNSYVSKWLQGKDPEKAYKQYYFGNSSTKIEYAILHNYYTYSINPINNLPIVEAKNSDDAIFIFSQIKENEILVEYKTRGGMLLWLYQITGIPSSFNQIITIINNELISAGEYIRGESIFPFIGGSPIEISAKTME